MTKTSAQTSLQALIAAGRASVAPGGVDQARLRVVFDKLEDAHTAIRDGLDGPTRAYLDHLIAEHGGVLGQEARADADPGVDAALQRLEHRLETSLNKHSKAVGEAIEAINARVAELGGGDGGTLDIGEVADQVARRVLGGTLDIGEVADQVARRVLADLKPDVGEGTAQGGAGTAAADAGGDVGGDETKAAAEAETKAGSATSEAKGGGKAGK